MELSHLVGGQALGDDRFEVASPFSGYSFCHIRLPRLHSEHASAALNQVTSAPLLTRDQKLSLLEALAAYVPPLQTLAYASVMTGMPIAWMERSVSEGKELTRSIASLGIPDASGKRVFVGITPNDPREYFFFFAHFLRTGNPSVVKLSAREPVLGYDIAQHLHRAGLPPGFLNIIYADTSSRDESVLLKELADHVDLAIVMGSTRITDRQLSFNAEHSRGVILDADYALPFIGASVASPLSCLAEHNYIIVGEHHFRLVLDSLVRLYGELRAGDLLERSTTQGMIEEPVRRGLLQSIELCRTVDSVAIHYPTDGVVMNGMGIVVEHFREDPSVGVNPLMVTPLPAYITCVRLVHSVDEAYADLSAASVELQRKIGVRSMALGIYGHDAADVVSLFRDVAYDISVNKSPLMIKGDIHQGIRLGDRL